MKTLAATLILSIGALTAEESSTMEIELRETVFVTGEGIFLQQLVSPQSAAKVPNTRLFPAPPAGETLKLDLPKLNLLIQEKAPELTDLEWTGAENITVHRYLRELNQTELSERLRESIEDRLAIEDGEVEIELTREWETIRIPDEPIQVKILGLPTTGLSPNFIVRFQLETEFEKLGVWHLPVRGRLLRDVLVADEAIERGELLDGSKLRIERRNVLAMRDPLAVSEADNRQYEFRSNVSAGDAIEARAVRERPLVHRRDLITAVLGDDGLQITLKVEALEDGVLGEVIRVRNPDSRVEFRGTIHDAQTIHVAL